MSHLQGKTHSRLLLGCSYFASTANHSCSAQGSQDRLSCLLKNPNSKNRKEKKVIIKCVPADFQELTKPFAELH